MNNPSLPNLVLENSPLLRSEPQYGAIVCLTCNNAFPRAATARHLSDRHHIPIHLYTPILKSLEHEPLAQDWPNLSRPTNGSPPIEVLKIRPGYACAGCGHLTTSDQIAQAHSKCGGHVCQVHLQRWNGRGAPAFWIVTPPPPPSPPEPNQTAADGLDTSQSGMFISFSLSLSC